MNIELFPQPGVDSGNNIGLAIEREPDMAKESLVENRLDRSTIVDTPLRHAVDGRAFGGVKLRHCLVLSFLLQYKIMNTLLQYPIQGTNASEIATSIEGGIHAGRIAHGATLPPVRALASSLKVSPTTIAAAYRTLRLRELLSG